MDDGLQMAGVPGFPGYFIRSDGKAFFADGTEKIVSCKKGRSAKLIIGVDYKMYTLGFATLIARPFIPNPWEYKLVIFKDRNHYNCHKDNIAWVDNETYNFYCTLGKRASNGRPKIYIERERAIELCTDGNLRNYYVTLDEAWAATAWREIDAGLSSLRYWKEVKGQVYLYFIDRIKRFSILGPPKGLLYIYAKYQYINQRRTLNHSVRFSDILRIDETLRW
jgi:hypothetical protein